MLWVSEKSQFAGDKAIRGGIPICWPWFGACPHDPKNPSHGFARTSAWSVCSCKHDTDSGTTTLRMSLRDSERTHEMWHYEFLLELRVSLRDYLEVEFVIKNTGKQSFHYTSALHTYFNVSNVHNIEITGLEDVIYDDLLEPETPKHQNGPVVIKGETDRIYKNHTGQCMIIDQEFNRKIIIEKSGSDSTVVWNPWIDKGKRMVDFGNQEYLRMVCVESANTQQKNNLINPDDEHQMTVRIKTDSMELT